MKLSERAQLLRQKPRLSIEAATTLVVDALGWGFDEALKRLKRAAKNGQLPVDVQPETNPIHGDVIAPVDSHKSTVATADLLVWIDELVRQSSSPVGMIVPAALRASAAAAENAQRIGNIARRRDVVYQSG